MNCSRCMGAHNAPESSTHWKHPEFQWKSPATELYWLCAVLAIFRIKYGPSFRQARWERERKRQGARGKKVVGILVWYYFDVDYILEPNRIKYTIKSVFHAGTSRQDPVHGQWQRNHIEKTKLTGKKDCIKVNILLSYRTRKKPKHTSFIWVI